ncbi:MAG: hypothetical protein ACI9JL_003644 [Paracoccaceae bacterium]|jgi:hypothetical protein
MIVSASYRTDVPAFHADWFRARLADGVCTVANPYGGKPSSVALRGDGVDGYVFWTRNAAPFAAALDDVAALDLPFVVQFTVTGYPRALDAHTPRAADAVAQITALAQKFGPRAVVWRYDPVVFTSITPADWHLRNFAGLAGKLSGSVDECVLSCAQIYKKTERRLNTAAKTHEFGWKDPNWDQKRELLSGLAELSADFGLKTTICSQPDALAGQVSDQLTPARCIDAARLSDIAGYDILARQKGNRDGCLCAESRDIGSYDTCAHGCVYCYAVSDHDRAVEKLRLLAGAG